MDIKLECPACRAKIPSFQWFKIYLIKLLNFYFLFDIMNILEKIILKKINYYICKYIFYMVTLKL